MTIIKQWENHKFFWDTDSQENKVPQMKMCRNMFL